MTRVKIMQATFHTDVDELITSLARMSRYAGQMMTNAAIVLHQSDLTRADVVIADCDHMTASLEDLEQRYLVLLAQQDPDTCR
jgi:phosphate uptake regulator